MAVEYETRNREEGTLHRLRAGFRPSVPDAGAKDRILRSATAPRRRRPAADRSTTNGWSRRTWRWAPVAAGVAIAILAGTIVLNNGDSADAATVAKRALAAVQQADSVTYYKMTGSFVDLRRPDLPAKWEAEYWVDHENHAYRYEVRSLAQEKGGPANGLTKGGTQPAQTVFGTSGSPQDVADSPAALEQAYQRMISSGAAQLGEETIDGIDTYKLQMTSTEALGSDTLSITETVDVSRSDYLPVQVITESRLNTGSDGPSTKETITLDEVKAIDRASVAAGTFDVQTPEGEEHVEGTLTLDQAKTFADFDLFWLGDSFSGLALDSIAYGRESGLAAEKAAWPAFRVTFTYAAAAGAGADSGGQPVTVMVSRKVPDQFLAQQLGAETQEKTVAGQTVLVADLQTGAGAVFDRGDVTVTVRAADQATVLSAVEKLAPLR